MNPRTLLPLGARPEGVIPGHVPSLIDRYARRADRAGRLVYRRRDERSPDTDVHLTLVDTTHGAGGMMALPPEHAALWHVIWTRDEPNTAVTISLSGAEASWPIAPGDSLLVPANGTVGTSGGQLGILVTAPALHVRTDLTPPTHGTDDFHGYNRRTAYPPLGNIAAHRWKLTQPLDLSSHYEGPTIVYSLAGDPALATPAESLTLRRGQAVLATLDRRTTVYPAGLGYILVIHPMRSGPSSL